VSLASDRDRAIKELNGFRLIMPKTFACAQCLTKIREELRFVSRETVHCQFHPHWAIVRRGCVE
jgi:hypothetical protein